MLQLRNNKQGKIKTLLVIFVGIVFVLVQVPLVEAWEAHVINVTATIVQPCEEGYSIAGYKFYDLNQNGTREEGEPGLPGWYIFIQKGPYESQYDYDNSGYVWMEDYNILSDVVTFGTPCPAGKDCDLNDDTVIDGIDVGALAVYITEREIEHKMTDTAGFYSFTGLDIGHYIVREIPQDGWLSISPTVKYAEIVECGEARVDFANFAESSCAALSIGYWQNHGGCPESSDWTTEINNLSNDYLHGAFTTITGPEICFLLAPKNCPSGGTVAGQRCRAQGKALGDLSNIVSGHLDINAVIAGADDGNSAFDNLGLTPLSTVRQALEVIESIIINPASTKAQLGDANYVGERIYAFYEDENPSFPACLYSWEELVQEFNTYQGLILGGELEPVLGCMDETAKNYNSEATEDDGSCEYKKEPPVSTTTEPVVIPGCMDQTALNYNSEATDDDESCEYEPVVIPGCMDQTALNYNPEATEDDQSCTYSVLGCMDDIALNYDTEATEDDGSCTYPEPEPQTPPEE